jgi:anaphase-promoting complex subunit 1
MIVNRGCDSEWLADLPWGVAMPILEMLRICHASPPKDWPAKAYAFIGRSDLAIQASGEGMLSRDTAVPDVCIDWLLR